MKVGYAVNPVLRSIQPINLGTLQYSYHASKEAGGEFRALHYAILMRVAITKGKKKSLARYFSGNEICWE